MAQAIPVLISPLLTRLFTPNEFGVFAIFLSIVLITASFASGKYELAIMIPKEPEKGVDLTLLSILGCFVVVTISIVPFWFFNQSIADLLKSPQVAPYLYLAPPTIFFVGVYQALFYFNSRKKAYKEIAYSKLYQAGGTAGLNVALGLTFGGVVSLIVGNIVGYALGVIYLVKNKAQHYVALKKRAFSSSVWAVAKEYKKFPIFFSFTYGLNTICGNITPFILATTFDVKYAGYYLIVQRVIVGPIGIVSRSLGNVFFQRVAQHKDNRRLYLKVSGGLFALGILPTLLIYFFGEQIFVLVFGKDWHTAGHIASILVVMYFLSFVSTPVSQFSTIHQKVLYNILWQVSLFASIMFSWYLGAKHDDVILYFMSFAVLQSALYIVGYFYEYYLCSKQARAYEG